MTDPTAPGADCGHDPTDEACVPDSACEPACSRRSVLGAAAALAAAPVLSQLGCARRVEPSRAISVCPDALGNLVVSRMLAPELDRIGGSVIVRPSNGTAPVLLTNAGDGFLAMHARCSHAGCEVTWVQEDRQAECPCHGSRFASDGAVLAPPATKSLDTFPVEVDRTTLDVIVRLKAGDGIFPALANGKVVFTTDDRPELQSVGGSVTGKPEGVGVPIIVLRFSQTEVRAFDATCTHLDCKVSHRSAQKLFVCPCHGSTYDETGHVTHDPAKTDLARYEAAFDGKTVTLSFPDSTAPCR